MASRTRREEENFPFKLFRMVEDEDYNEIIRWNEVCRNFCNKDYVDTIPDSLCTGTKTKRAIYIYRASVHTEER